jgi:UBX domain-containing protein 1
MSDPVAEFAAVTGADAETARQYLELANGNVNAAVDIYFGNPAPAAPPSRPVPTPTPAHPLGPATRPSPGVPGRPPPGPPKPFNPKSTYDDIFSHLQELGTQDSELGQVEQCKITVWKNGFQVDDGEFRPVSDPANQDFLDCLARNTLPRELNKPGVTIDIGLMTIATRTTRRSRSPGTPGRGRGESSTGPHRPSRGRRPGRHPGRRRRSGRRILPPRDSHRHA